MTIEDLERHLLPFSRFHYDDDDVEVREVFAMPGHAGFSYGFSVVQADKTHKWYIRLPPPNVKLQGTADVLRQVAALNVLPDSVPHCQVKWSGDDPQWFGRPYFIVPQLEGDVIRVKEDRILSLDPARRILMARQAINALVETHRIDHQLAPYLGKPISLQEDVIRWDRFVEKAADSEKLNLAAKVKQLLLGNLPADTPVGIFHGDFQWSNLFYSNSFQLLAVIDWELVGVGSTLNDIGWFATFNDPVAWADSIHSDHVMPHAEELITMYEESWGSELPEIAWFRALAAYKFAIITGFNLMLHRRGKRQDPVWEITKDSMESLLQRAEALLT